MLKNIKKLIGYRIKRIFSKDLELKDRLALTFVSIGFFLSLLGVLISIIFSLPIWYLLPNVLLAVLCLIAPLVSDQITKLTSPILMIVAYLYIPFLYFTSGGLESSAAMFFVMITVYEAFYYKGKALNFHVAASLTLYVFVIAFSEFHPQFLMIEELLYSQGVSSVLSVVIVSTVISIIAATTFNGYDNEHSKSNRLMLELEKQNEKLMELSIRDQLTGLYNRRYFLEVLQSELDYFKKYKQHFYVLMLDLDGFKQINDSYGHLFGDEVLRKIATQTMKSARDYDVVARYGGEEFCIIISHLNPENIMIIADRIRLQIEELKLRNDTQITVSVGVACNCENDTVEQLIERADSMLYKAKLKGKNRVEYIDC